MESRREDLVEFLGEEKMVGVDEASERLSGVVSVFVFGCRAIVVRDVLALVFPAGDEGWVEDRSGLRGGRKLSVHLGVLGELGLRKHGSAGGSSLWDMGVYGVTVPRRCRRGDVSDGVEVDPGIPSNHVGQLRCDVFRGSSLKVLGLLVHFKVVCRVVRRCGLECGWEWVGQAVCRGA